MMDYKCNEPFDFTLPTKIVYGPGRVREVVGELKALGGTRPLVITDKGIRPGGGGAVNQSFFFQKMYNTIKNKHKSNT